MDSQRPERFRIHLPTALLLTILLSGIIGINTRPSFTDMPKELGEMHDAPYAADVVLMSAFERREVRITQYGWLCIAYETWNYLSHSRQTSANHLFGFIGNQAIALLTIIFTGIALERLITIRERKKTEIKT